MIILTQDSSSLLIPEDTYQPMLHYAPCTMGSGGTAPCILKPPYYMGTSNQLYILAGSHLSKQHAILDEQEARWTPQKVWMQ